MVQSKNFINMTEGPILKNIVLFAFPLLISNLLQLLYNAADLIVVSNWAGSLAMGSVGATGSLNALLISSVIGISVGSTVVIARYFGAKDKEGIFKAIHTSMALAIILGIMVLIFSEALATPILKLMDTPREVFDGAVLYTRILYLGVPAQMVYNFCAAILRALGDTRRPMYILAITGIVNVALNLVLVIVFHMDVDGVAIATITAQYLSAAFAFVLLLKEDQDFKLIPGKIRIHKRQLKEILGIGIPNTISSCLISFSNVVLTSAVNSFGAAAISGYAASGNIGGFIYMGMGSVSQATLTAISQNYGAKNRKRLFKSMRRCIYLVACVGIVLGGIVAIFSKPLLGIYIKDSAEAISFGHIRNMMVVSIFFVCGIMEVLSQVVRGLGYSTTATVNSIWTLVGTMLVWIHFVLPLNHKPEILFVCCGMSWVIAIITHSITIAVVKNKAMERMYAE